MKKIIKVDKEVEIKTPFFGYGWSRNYIAITDSGTIVAQKNMVVATKEPFDDDLANIAEGKYTECTEEEFVDAYMAAQGLIKESFKKLIENWSK